MWVGYATGRWAGSYEWYRIPSADEMKALEDRLLVLEIENLVLKRLIREQAALISPQGEPKDE